MGTGAGGRALGVVWPDNPGTAERVLQCSSVSETVLFYRIQEKIYKFISTNTTSTCV